MKFAPVLEDDDKRLLDLKKYAVLDTPAEAGFDEITKLAATVCDAKISLISLIDKDRQWFKSRFGLDALETPRDISFCGHAIMGNDIFIVEDAEVDERFCDNPLFLNEPNVRFYAGVPLVTPNGSRIGTLCVIDSQKKVLSDTQKQILTSLAKQVMHLFELKLKNEELLYLSKQYSAVQSISKTGGWELDVATLSIIWSEEIYRIHGIPVGTQITRDLCLARYAPHEHDRLHKLLASVKNDGLSEEGEFELVDTTGVHKWVLLRTHAILDKSGKVFRIMGTLKDISVQKKASLELQKSSMDLIEAQAISKVGSWIFDLHTNQQTWSLEHYKIFEIDPPQAQERLHELYRSRIHPEDLAELDRIVGRAISKGEGFIYDHRVFLDNGKRIKYVQGIGKVTKDQTGKPIYISGTCRDRTYAFEQEKKLDEEKKRSYHNSKLAAIGQFSAGVGHEINNPLAIISGHITIAEHILKESENAPAEVFERLNKMGRAVSRIANIVNGLRNFARPDDGFDTDFDPCELVSETVNMFKELYFKEVVALTLTGNKKDSFICGDRGRVQQVLVNLISNAKDATVGVPNRKIDVSFSFEEGHIKFVITDNGCGIPDEIKEKIFEPFFTTKEINQGTGIGLSIVRTIIEEHKGKFELNSKVGVGSTFTVFFPVTFGQAVMVVDAESGSSTAIQGKIPCNVLIVDDEEDLREIFQFIISNICSNVVVAESAQTGYDIVAQGQIDIVISDIRMPSLDGFDFFRMIRQNKKIIQPKFVFLTGGVQMSEEELQIIQFQSDGLLIKPLVRNEILNKIKELFPERESKK